jgi:alkanesulfonate monooxygenase SsuD/methylene tetrahydromethanopterin reductase-like flavin-dependent oxidoreductase (luciferase family)
VQRLIADHFDEAADYVEVLRRLWDSWEDEAEIRDVVTGRFIDRNKLHYIDFEGRWFSVKGPSITRRPPQGQPVIAALGHASVAYQLIARSADVGFVTPRDAAHAAEIVTQIRADARVYTGTAAGLADLLQDWQAAGLSGFRLRPAALPHDLTYLTERLVPELQRRGLFRTAYDAGTLRGLLGLGRPGNHYAAA